MRQRLKLHPDFVCPPVREIAVDVSRSAPGSFTFHYTLTGTAADLAIQPPGPAHRADDLWEHSCFEAFVRPEGSQAYWELNFAPSSEWAVYGLDSYRSGMTAQEAIAPPAIETAITANGLHLMAQIELDLQGPVDLALSAVIEEANGRKSYWALAHPSGKADFHHPDSFVLKLPGTTS